MNHTAAAQPIGWPIPVRALVIGGAFLLLMGFTFIGAFVGFMVGFAIAMYGGPFMLAYGPERGPQIAMALTATLVIGGFIGPMAAVFTPRGREDRRKALGAAVLYVCAVAGVALSLHTLQEAWP